jgi:hypothetical protein
MPLTRLIAAVLLASAPGCAHKALVGSTIAATRTIQDLDDQQVLDNIAKFVVNRGALPHFAVVSGGTFQMNDTVGVTPSLSWDAFGLTSVMLGFSGERNAANQWSMDPVSDPEKLNKMRCLYRYVVDPLNPDYCLKCQEYFAALSTSPKAAMNDLAPSTAHAFDACGIPAGFFRCGRKCNVPPRACYVSCCGETYVWVEPQGLDGLTRLTLLVLDLATAEPAQTKTTRKSVASKAVGKAFGQGPVQEEETTTETISGGRIQFVPRGLQFTK